MLAASRLGSTNRLARPFSVLLGSSFWRRASSHAVSPCISPSTFRRGLRLSSISRTARIFSASLESWLPKLECDSSATFGSMPNSFMRYAACSVASVICSAVGSSCTWVSTKKNTPCWLITPVIAEVEVTLASSGSTLRT